MEAGDGEGDADTRLTLSLKEKLTPMTSAYLTSFTLCMWYYATGFQDASTLLSYAISEMDDAIRISIHSTYLFICSLIFLIYLPVKN